MKESHNFKGESIVVPTTPIFDRWRESAHQLGQETPSVYRKNKDTQDFWCSIHDVHWHGGGGCTLCNREDALPYGRET